MTRSDRIVGRLGLCRILGFGGLAAACLSAACSQQSSGSVAENGGSGAGGGGDTDAGPDGVVIGTGSRGSGTGGTGGQRGCGESTLEASHRPANLLLVIDRSKSMDSPPDASQADGGTLDSKWSLMRSQLVDSLDSVKDRLAFGVQLFPYSEMVSDPLQLLCHMPPAPVVQVPVASGTSSIGAVRALLDGTAPAGSTPTAVALGQALEHFTTGPGVSLAGDKYLLLATDGGPNCNADLVCPLEDCITNREGLGASCTSLPEGNCCVGSPAQCLDEQRTVLAIEQLADAGIHTFVVGIPGSELYSETLNRFADAGREALTPTGDPRYFKVEAAGNMQNLSDILSRITTQLVTTCRLQLKSVPPDALMLNVYIDGTVIPQQGDDGWKLDDSTTPPTVELKGATCERMQTTGAEHVSIQYGCPTVL
jgi:hypothetical protein